MPAFRVSGMDFRSAGLSPAPPRGFRPRVRTTVGTSGARCVTLTGFLSAPTAVLSLGRSLPARRLGECRVFSRHGRVGGGRRGSYTAWPGQAGLACDTGVDITATKGRPSSSEKESGRRIAGRP